MKEQRPNPEPSPDDPALTEDLVAFLDGELDPEMNEAVEAKIGVDATVRAEADALKKTWDLLDYLPRPEPSPNFTERTLSRLEPVPQSGANNVPSGATPSRNATAPLPRASTAILPVPSARSPRHKVLWATAWILIFTATGFGGFLLHEQYAAHFARIEKQEKRIQEQEQIAKDRRLLQNLSLYRLVDDLDFARQLDDPELFGDEPGSISATWTLSASRPRDDGAADEADKSLRRQYRYFQSLSEDRREQIRALDREFSELDEETQGRLRLVLERYGYWLAKLPEEDRRRIEPARPSRRLEYIEELRGRDWVQTLPKPYRDNYEAATTSAEKRHLVKEWRQEEKDRADEWEFVKRNEPKGGGLPVFLEDARTKADFDLFVLNLESQLPPGEAATLKRARTAAQQDGLWLDYAIIVARLSDRHPLLPGPPDGPKHFSELPNEIQKFLIDRERATFGKKNLPAGPLARSSGRWPDFAVAVSEYARSKSWMLPRQLGPARKDDKDMPAEVRTFIEKTLEPTLTRLERADRPFMSAQAKKDRERLRAAEGLWPDYPRTVVDLARQYKLMIPGWTLPSGANFRPDAGKKLPRNPGKG